jgi:hypothetical protein
MAILLRALVVVFLALATWRAWAALAWWDLWQYWKTTDRSAAELYQTDFFIEVALTAVALLLAGGALFLLGFRNRSVERARARARRRHGSG